MNNDLNNNSNIGNTQLKYPEIGTKVKCLVLKSSFTQAILKILEIDGIPTPIDYKAILKGNGIGEEIYICDKIKINDEIECVITSFGDNGIFVSQYD